MYWKITPIKNAKALKNLDVYCANSDHPNHTGKQVHSTHHYNFPKADTDFVSWGLGVVDSMKGQIRRGRQLKNVGYILIGSTAEKAAMTEEEQNKFVEKLLREMGNPPCAVNWHTDLQTGRADCHLRIFNFLCWEKPPRALTKATTNINALRMMSDDAEEAINLEREAQGREKMETMKYARLKRKKAKGLEPLALQLAKIGLKGLEDLVEKVVKLGHSVSRFNYENISILHKGGKKACRYDVSTLLAEAAMNKTAVQVEAEISIHDLTKKRTKQEALGIIRSKGRQH